MVNTILDATKIESGRFDIFPEPFDVGSLINLCCDMVGLKAEQSRVELVRDIAPGVGEIVGDKRACKQVLLNLLSNALKFTPAEGRVTIAVRPDGTSIVISVSDTGIGISPRDLPKLGDPFFQAQSTYDRAVDGNRPRPFGRSRPRGPARRRHHDREYAGAGHQRHGAAAP